jgi:hypothetical protein
MIEETFAAGQLRRLQNLNFPPTTPEAINELLGAVMSAPNEQSCRDAIGLLAQTSKEWPKPAEIRKAILSVSGPKVQSKGGGKCRLCGDSGLIEMTGNRFFGKAFPGTAENLLEAFAHCPLCAAGGEVRLLMEGERQALGMGDRVVQLTLELPTARTSSVRTPRQEAGWKPREADVRNTLRLDEILRGR